MSYNKRPNLGQATMANSEPVVIASDQSAVPVSGTVTANLSATDNAVLDAIELDTTTIAGAVSGTEMQVDVITMPTVTVTATNLDVQSGGADLATSTQASAIQTAVQLIDDTVQVLGTDTYTEATSKGITLGAVRRDADTTLVNTTNEFTPLQVDANGRLKVEAFSGETLPVSLTSTTVTGTVAVTQSGTWDEVGINDSGNSITVDDGGASLTVDGTVAISGSVDTELPTAAALADNTVNPTTTSVGTFNHVFDGTTWDRAPGTSADGALVNLGTNNDVTVTGTVTANLAAGTNNIGDVDVLTLPVAFNSGATSATTLRVIAATDSPEVTALQIMDDWDNGASDGASVSGDVAHDTVDAGEPVKIGMKAYELDGTAPQTAVAEADRVNAISDLVGRQYVATEHPRFWHASVDYASAQTNASIKAAPGAGVALYITDILISNGATAGNITLLDGSGGTVLLEVYPGVNGGAVLNLKNPIKLTDNTALVITSTTVTTHSVFVSGFID